MNELQAQLQEVTDQLAQLDPNNRDNLVEIASLEQKKAVLIMKMDDAKAQEEQQAAQMVRIQAQEENKEGLGQFVQDLDLFETFFPQDKYAEIMGLSEYVDQRQLFNQILHQAFVQIEDQRNDKHNADIAERDEKVLVLKSAIKQNGEDYDKNVQELNKLLSLKDSEIDQLAEDKFKISTEYNSLEASCEKVLTELKQAQEQAEQLATENEKLKEQVEAFKTLSPKPTASIADLLNQAKIKSSAELALERTSPFRGKVEVTIPTVEQVLPFRDSQVDQTNVEPSADPAEVTAPEVQFPDPGAVHEEVQVDPRVSIEDGQGHAETVSRAEFEALKTIVNELCEVCNIAEVA